MLRTLLPILLAFAGAAPAARAHDLECPDQRASQVDAKVSYSGSAKTCGVGLVIFGVGGGIVGEKCYPLKITTPAHQECQGEPGEGTRCVPDGELEVKAEKCHCGGLVVPILQIGVPTTCVCSDAGSAGTVEDSETVLCAEV